MSDDVEKVKQRLAELDVQLRKLDPDALSQALITVVGTLTQMIDGFAAEVGSIKQRLSRLEEDSGIAGRPEDPPPN
jgi:hypothetical protein